jgi:transcriptional regulator with XRE-family HTH domain
MADYLEVSRNTVSAWINGRTQPRNRDVRLWALRTGFPYEWVRDGIEPTDNPNGPAGLGIISPKLAS